MYRDSVSGSSTSVLYFKLQKGRTEIVRILTMFEKRRAQNGNTRNGEVKNDIVRMISTRVIK